jgi:hypothetical protein
MCEPVSIIAGITAVAGGVAAADTARKARHAAEDALRGSESDAAEAQSRASQSANAKVAADNRRRREQKSLLATGAPGAPQPTFGDEATTSVDAPFLSNARTLLSRSTRSGAARPTSSLLASGGGGRATIGSPRRESAL